MATTPAASPSRPSIRFTALVMPMTHRAVSNGVTSGESTTNPARGTLNWNQSTPKKYRMDAARTCPAILAGADMSRMSSMTPTTKIAVAPRIRPSGSEEPWNSERSWGMRAATEKATSRATNMATPPAWGVTRWWTFRSSGWATYPIRVATRRTGKVVRNDTSMATAKTTPYQSRGTPAITGVTLRSRPGQGRVWREFGAEGPHLFAHRPQRRLVVPVRQGAADQPPHHPHLVDSHAGRGLGGRPQSEARGHEGRPGIVGDRVAVAGDPGLVEHLLGHLSRELGVEGTEVHEDLVVLGSPGHQEEAHVGQGLPEGGGVGHHLPGIVGELGLGPFGEGHRLGRDHVLQRYTLQPWEDCAVDGLGVLGAGQDGAPPGPAQGLVGGQGHDIGHTNRRRMDLAGDEPGGMGGVEHEEGTDGIGDLTEG